MSDFSIDLLVKIPKMTPADAASFLAELDLTDDERAALLAKAGTKLAPDSPRVLLRAALKKTVSTYTLDPARPRWIAAAYLLGASLRQLAALHNVRHTTIYQSLSKTVSVEDRRASRLNDKLSLEALSTYHVSYYAHLADLENNSPVQVAQWLLDNTELDK